MSKKWASNKKVSRLFENFRKNLQEGNPWAKTSPAYLSTNAPGRGNYVDPEFNMVPAYVLDVLRDNEEIAKRVKYALNLDTANSGLSGAKEEKREIMRAAIKEIMQKMNEIPALQKVLGQEELSSVMDSTSIYNFLAKQNKAGKL